MSDARDSDPAGSGDQDGGRIVLAGTPIGHDEDASPRLRRLLAQADVIAAEDTRRLRSLTQRLGVTVQGVVRSYHEHNESERAQELVQAAAGGALVVVVSDAGMPGVADPGYRVVQAAAQAGVLVTTAPGPSAALAALALSGLPSDRFTFEGFLPRKGGERRRVLQRLATEQRTMVFYESPRRAGASLTDMAQVFGADRAAAVCRELTKTYEQVRRGALSDLASWAQDGLLGEVSIVVAGAPAVVADPADHVHEVLARAAAGARLKDAAAEVSAHTGASKRELYEQALRARS